MEDIKKEPEQKEIFLTITYTPDGVIDLKGQVINNEMLAIWILEKAKDMIKAHTLQKTLEAQSRIISPNKIMNFVRRKK